MRLEKWFISNLDDSQRQIIIRDPNENLIVQGSAGSGKTNLWPYTEQYKQVHSATHMPLLFTQWH